MLPDLLFFMFPGAFYVHFNEENEWICSRKKKLSVFREHYYANISNYTDDYCSQIILFYRFREHFSVFQLLIQIKLPSHARGQDHLGYSVSLKVFFTCTYARDDCDATDLGRCGRQHQHLRGMIHRKGESWCSAGSTHTCAQTDLYVRA